MPKPWKCLTQALPEISVALALPRVCGRVPGPVFWRLAGRRPALWPRDSPSFLGCNPRPLHSHTSLICPWIPPFLFFGRFIGMCVLWQTADFVSLKKNNLSYFYVSDFRLDCNIPYIDTSICSVDRKFLLETPRFHVSRYVWQIRQLIVMFAALLHHNYYLVQYNTDIALKTICLKT